MSRELLAEMSVKEFLGKLGSGDPTPGGGAAAALSAAMGASLIMMVTNHTIGKAKYAELEEHNIEVRKQAEVLRNRFTEGIDRDAEAFRQLSAAFAMPRSLDKTGENDAEDAEAAEAELKAARSAAIGTASVIAAEAPLAVMQDCVGALRLAASLPGRSNPALLSDVLVAAHCLHSGLLSANYNVEANMPAIERRNPELASDLAAQAASFLEEGEALLSDITSA